ncbi:MAG: fatty acid desaturase, partial [Lutimaribacter sp.]
MSHTLTPPANARQWLAVLARYRDPSLGRSVFELAATLLPFLMIWALAWWLLAYAPVASFGL